MGLGWLSAGYFGIFFVVIQSQSATAVLSAATRIWIILRNFVAANAKWEWDGDHPSRQVKSKNIMIATQKSFGQDLTESLIQQQRQKPGYSYSSHSRRRGCFLFLV